jgi:hypothetical protein
MQAIECPVGLYSLPASFNCTVCPSGRCVGERIDASIRCSFALKALVFSVRMLEMRRFGNFTGESRPLCAGACALPCPAGTIMLREGATAGPGERELIWVFSLALSHLILCVLSGCIVQAILKWGAFATPVPLVPWAGSATS